MIETAGLPVAGTAQVQVRFKRTRTLCLAITRYTEASIRFRGEACRVGTTPTGTVNSTVR